MTLISVFQFVVNFTNKYIHQILSWIKFGQWGRFYISPKAKLTGAKNIYIGANSKIFRNSELNTSATPYNFPYKINNPSGSIIIGLNCKIKNNVHLITYGGKIIIGNNSTINPFSIVYGQGGVIIGDNVMIAAHAVIVSSNHIFTNLNEPICKQGSISKGIVIKNNVWIGAGVKILDGVIIGTGSIIAAGAVVTKNIPDYVIAGGVPAKILKIRHE